MRNIESNKIRSQFIRQKSRHISKAVNTELRIVKEQNPMFLCSQCLFVITTLPNEKHETSYYLDAID